MTLAVDSWGDIYPCFPWAEMRRAAGNVRQTRLAAFWQSEQAAKMRNEASHCRDCYWNNHTELNLMLSNRRKEVVGYARAPFSRSVPEVLLRQIENKARN